MTSILFSTELTGAHLYKLPEKIRAISYKYASDSLFIYAHLKDRCAKFTKNLTMSQCTFEHVLAHTSREERFKQILPIKFWLRGTKIENNEVYQTKFASNFSNVSSSDHSICWGGNLSNYKTMKGVVEAFFGSGFNGDYCKNKEFFVSECKENIKRIREISKFDENYVKSNSKLICQEADALYMIHCEDNMPTYVKMLFAGFKPLPENSSIIVVPLRATTIQRDGHSYYGYVTPVDPCGKKWFILSDGRLVGQMDNYKSDQPSAT